MNAARTSRKSVDAEHWHGRLTSATSYLKAARDHLTLADEGANCAPAVSLVVTAAIAYADSVTAKRALTVNQRDHSTAAQLLRDVLGRELPDRQERFLRRILGAKDEAQYGTRHIPKSEAMGHLESLQAFAHWAEELLAD